MLCCKGKPTSNVDYMRLGSYFSSQLEQNGNDCFLLWLPCLEAGFNLNESDAPSFFPMDISLPEVQQL